MDERGKIISTCDVDKNLTLQIWTKGKTPRLCIVNRYRNTRKLIQLSWVEDSSHIINIKNPDGENISYSIEKITPILKKILVEFVMRTQFKAKFLRLSHDIERALYNPEYILDLDGLPMLSDENRSALWFAVCTTQNKRDGKFKPFFPVRYNGNDDNDEAAAIDQDKLIFKDNARSIDNLIKTGTIANLKAFNPERWDEPIKITAAAILLGFSFCNEDGTIFSNAIWENKRLQPDHMVKTHNRTAISIRMPELKNLGYKLSAYVRHFYQADKIQVSYSFDSAKDLQDSGYERTRRVDFQAGTLGDVPYKVTLYETPDNFALSCVPEMSTIRHNGEMKIIMPLDIFKEALKIDTNPNGTQDSFYTITRLFWTYEFKKWLDNISQYVKIFTRIK